MHYTITNADHYILIYYEIILSFYMPISKNDCGYGNTAVPHRWSLVCDSIGFMQRREQYVYSKPAWKKHLSIFGVAHATIQSTVEEAPILL